MARIPDEQIARIKREVSLLRLAESQGYKPIKQGKEYAVNCPFHDDKTPSCMINPEKNEFNCFGCDAGGSVIDWVMKTKGIGFRLACELLLKDIGVVAEKTTKVVKRSSTIKLSSSLATDLLENLSAPLNCVTDYYHQTMLNSPEALAYLEKRGLNDPQLIKQFKLGFANRTLAYHIPDGNRKEGKRIRTALAEVGVLRKTGHEHLNGSIVVPLWNAEGSVVKLYGRKIAPKNQLPKNSSEHLYLLGPHTGVWNREGLVNHPEVILCESLIDAMTFWVHGFKHVTCSYGTQGFTDEHLQCFKELNIQRILIAYDRDESGDLGCEKLAKKLQEQGFECFRILFPQGMDANEFALQGRSSAARGQESVAVTVEAESKTEAQEKLSELIRKAEWLGSGKAPERQLTLIAPEMITEKLVSYESEHVEIKDQEPVKKPRELPPLAANSSPVPVALTSDIACKVTEREINLDCGGRLYRARGFKADQPPGQMKITLMVSNDAGFHTDTFDLYHAKQRQVFSNQSSVELEVKDDIVKKDLGKVLLKLETLQDEQQQPTAPKKQTQTLSSEEREAALNLLKDPNLLDRIINNFNQLGLIGEESNKLVAYLACVSRKLDKPLGVVIQSSSAAGKSSLMDAVLNLMPEEERLQYSAMTGQSLFYMGETNLKNKILAIAEEEGASNASYALKLLQSEGEITIASTSKDDNSGDLITKKYRVEGPTQLFMTTTAIDVDEELMNRCLILSVDESQQQTEAIHAQQRYGETLEGVFAKATKDKLIEQHRHAQRLLKPYAIVNPYAEQLRFLSDKTRTRRDHMKYLTLIKTIALLHQYQREIKIFTKNGETLTYLEVTLEDIQQANQLMHQVLGKSLDELPPQTRNLLEQIHQWVSEHCQQRDIEQAHFRFSRRDIRTLSGWSDNQLKLHCRRLQELEYLLVHNAGRGQAFVYELLYDGSNDNGPHMMGLLDINTLKKPVQREVVGVNDVQVGVKLPPSWAEVGGVLSSG